MQLKEHHHAKSARNIELIKKVISALTKPAPTLVPPTIHAIQHASSTPTRLPTPNHNRKTAQNKKQAQKKLHSVVKSRTPTPTQRETKPKPPQTKLLRSNKKIAAEKRYIVFSKKKKNNAATKNSSINKHSLLKAAHL
jgi:hypothetical protein